MTRGNGAIQASLEVQQKSNAWLDVRLREGRTAKFAGHDASGLNVTRLIRTAYGPFQLGKMDRGQVIEVSGKVMRDQIAGLENVNPAKAVLGEGSQMRIVGGSLRGRLGAGRMRPTGDGHVNRYSF